MRLASPLKKRYDLRILGRRQHLTLYDIFYLVQGGGYMNRNIIILILLLAFVITGCKSSNSILKNVENDAMEEKDESENYGFTENTEDNSAIVEQNEIIRETASDEVTNKVTVDLNNNAYSEYHPVTIGDQILCGSKDGEWYLLGDLIDTEKLSFERKYVENEFIQGGEVFKFYSTKKNGDGINGT